MDSRLLAVATQLLVHHRGYGWSPERTTDELIELVSEGT